MTTMNPVVFATMSEEMILLLTFGIMFCSILCVFAALRNNGAVLENMVMMLLCQAFILLAAMMHLGTGPVTIVSRVMGMVTLAMGIAPTVIRKTSFQGARYCVAFGALMAAITMLLF